MLKKKIGRPRKTKEDMTQQSLILNQLKSISQKVDSIHSQLNVKDKDYLTAKEASQYMGWTRATLWKWCRDGKINRVKLANGKTYYATVELKRLLDNGVESIETPQNISK